jgi:hypothetical protein
MRRPRLPWSSSRKPMGSRPSSRLRMIAHHHPPALARAGDQDAALALALARREAASGRRS